LRGKSSLREREDTRISSKRLIITRLKNIQVGRGQYLYQTVRRIWGTRPVAQTKRKKVGAKVEARKRITRWKEQ